MGRRCGYHCLYDPFPGIVPRGFRGLGQALVHDALAAGAAATPWRARILWTLLGALLAAAVMGLVLLVVGGQEDVLRVLVTVLVFAGALVLAVPGYLHPSTRLQISTSALCALDAVVAWVLIWMPGSWDAADWVGRTAGLITALLVIGDVALILLLMVRGPRLRAARVAMWISHVTGAALLMIVWLAILTDGETTPPARIIGGLAIIYIATSLSAILISVIRRYKIVPRDA